MSEVVIVSLISLFGSLFGTFGGIIASSKLTSYRLKRLEEQVQKHNCVVERTYILEGSVKELQHDFVDIKRRCERC